MLPKTADFGPGERAAWVKQSIDICEKKGVLGAGYIPKEYQTTCLSNSEGLFAYYQARGNRLRPHLPHGERRRLGLVGDHRRERSVTGRRRRS